MTKHIGLRIAQYAAEWIGVFTLIVLIVVFSLTGWLISPPPLEEGAQVSGYENPHTIRAVLLVLFLLAMAIDGILLMFARLPGMFRYPVPISATNVQAQYILGKIVLNATTSITNVYACVSMYMVFERMVRLDGLNFLMLSGAMGMLYVLDWLIYYAFAQSYR